jgi:succinate dehydrogenase / fumarate reductase, iron-sulfur subunit
MSLMNLTLRIWRQASPDSPGRLETYPAKNISPHMSFLEMLDVLNEGLIKEGKEPVEVDSDCREGICGTCGLVINGIPHGPKEATATCQLHMRSFNDGDVITVEPWRADALPIIKDLVVDRSAFDRIIAQGGYTSIATGSAADANEILIGKDKADRAFDAAACIGCGACVAACPNASAALFVGAKVAQYTFMPQGHPERDRRALGMVEQMDKEGFGNCSNHAECEAVCPKGISVEHIAIMRREYLRGALREGSASRE